jgi:predicted nucleic-acid-binding protein
VTGLDTNVLVRFFAQDDPQQSPQANRMMSSLTVREPGWVATATILELVWVLTSKMRLDRGGIARILDRLLRQEKLVVEQASVVEGAYRLYRSGNADFADCLISSSAKAAGCARTVTFDRRAARDAGMELIG